MAKRVAEAVQRKSYDLAFVFGSSMAQYAEPWPKWPKILDLVDVDSDKWAQYADRSRPPLSWIWRLEGRRLQSWERELVETFSNTIVCTDAEARLLRSEAPIGEINVLQNSVDTDYYRPDAITIPETIQCLQPYVVFTGSMDYFPNVDAVGFFAREVLPLVRQQIPNLSFVIAGRKPAPEVGRLVESDSSIVVTGEVRDTRPYLRGASVAVAPMRIARGVQNKILEALSMDVPVVASPIAAAALPKELVSLVAVDGEPAQIAARVKDYVLNPPRPGARRAFLRRFLELLNLPAQLEQLVKAAAAPAAQERGDKLQVLFKSKWKAAL